MSGLIEIYHNSINNNFSSLQMKYAQCEFSSNEQKLITIGDIETLIKETESVIKNYTIECTMQNDKALSAKATTFKAYIDNFKAKLKKMKVNASQLINQSGNHNADTEENLLGKDEALAYNSFEKLQKATRGMIELENVSGGIMCDLNTQTEQMKGVKGKLGDMNDQLSSSSSLLGNMLQNQNRTKSIIVIFGIVLFITFTIIFGIKYFWLKNY